MKSILKKYPLLFIIAAIALILRLYKVNTDLLDWHSWRQADTASVTREFTKKTLNPLYPTYHDLSNIPSGLDNPNGYRMVEFPLYNVITAALLKAAPSLPLVPTSRVVSSLFSIGTLFCLFFLARSYFGKKAGYFAAFFFAVLPYSVFYSRVILPEPIMVFFSTLSITMFRFYVKKPKPYLYWVSLISLAAALLLKPFVAFLLPVYAVMLFEERTLKKIITDFRLYAYAILAIIPFLLWRNWITNFPEGIPASDWLFNGNGIRLRPAWFRWLGYERITKLILGYVGVIFLPISLFQQLKNKKFFLPAWWFGIGLYFVVVATGNVQHDYYQAITTPVISLTLAHAILVLDTFLNKKFNALVSMGISAFLVVAMLLFSYNQVKGYYNVNHPEYSKAGKAADEVLPKDAKVIAPQYGGDTAYLFQINRTGWPIGHYIDEKIKMGATHYVTTSFDEEAKELEKKYTIIEKTSDYSIIDLTRPRE
ncbi:MAG: hypothetical protein BroJett025_04570 [Patescibacteria group bacterium]|nr:MAG: hypothetical protein BroJett025_04570 [Patescibacteria group bacterium]